MEPSTDNIENPPNGIPNSFYDFFLLMAERECSDAPKTIEHLHEKWQFHKTQLKKWLDKAADDNKMEKLDDTEGYRWILLSESKKRAVPNPPMNGELPEQVEQLGMQLESGMTPSQATDDQSQTRPTAKSA